MPPSEATTRTDETTADPAVDAEVEPLTSMRRRLTVIADYVGMACDGTSRAIYLMGRPGSGKSWWVRRCLRESGVPHVWANGQLTAVSLFELLFGHPDAVVVIDDVPLLFADKQARQYLMAACDSQDPRVVDRRVFGDERRVEFAGAVIAVSNEELPSGPTGDALRSRFDLLRHDPSDAEVAAYVLATMCETPEDVEAAEWAVDRVAEAGERLTIRHAETALRFRRDGREGRRTNDWKYLFSQTLTSFSSVHREAGPAEPEDRADVDREAADAYERWGGDPDAAAEECGCSRATLYRRRARWLDRSAGPPRLPR